MNHGHVLPNRLAISACAAALLLGTAAIATAGADPRPIRIAVFDFELDDFSGGAGIAGDRNADLAYLDQATGEVRRLIAGSGRYSLVDVSKAGDENVKERTLHLCHGCEATVAHTLGAEQSFVGVVTRISRTDYAVRFEIRDARSGDVLRARNSDLRLGADYAWARGAASLVKTRLLNEP